MRISDWSSDVCSSDLAGSAVTTAGSLSDTAMQPTCGLATSAATTRPSIVRPATDARHLWATPAACETGYCGPRDRKSVVEGKRVSVRVDRGGRRITEKQTM